MAYGYPYSTNYNNYNTYSSPYMATGYNSPNYSTVPPVAQTNMPQTNSPQPPRTNKVFVTSLEDAIQRPTEPNSENIYLDQDKPLLYEIKTDFYGKKTSVAYSLAPYVDKTAQNTANIDLSTLVTRDEYNSLLKQLKGVESQLHALVHPAQNVQETIDNIE